MRTVPRAQKLTDKLLVIRDTLLTLWRYGFLKLRCRISRARPGVREKRHLLILAWLFPPMITGGVYRPLSFARYAAERGWHVTVVAGPSPEAATDAGLHLNAQLPRGVRVVRIGTPRLNLSYRFFPHLDGGLENVVESIESVLALEDFAPSVVLASGPPFHNFVVAWHLSRHFQAPLVLDYRDEWTQCPFDFVSAGDFDLAWEKRCLQQARSVVMTTGSFVEQARQAFPEIDPAKYYLVPNGFDPADLPPPRPATPPATRTERITIAFLGFLGSHTPPDGFVSTLLQTLKLRPDLAGKVRLRFVGSRTPGIEQRMRAIDPPGVVELVDQVPKPEALRIMQESTALLVLNPAPLKRYLPGKLFDYLAVGTPILVYGEGGEAANIVSELHAGPVVPEDDPQALAVAIDRIVSPVEVKGDSARGAWLASHHRKVLANSLLDHLDTL